MHSDITATQLDLGKLEMHYQIQWCEEKQSLVGMEALIRMRTSQGLLAPDQFLPDLIKAGMTDDLTRFTMEQVCRDVLEMERGGIDLDHVGINFSCDQISSEGFKEEIERILLASPVDPRKMVIEITESDRFGDLDHLVDLINSLNSIGVLFALDDFCTGYSTIEHLCKLPIDYLKIDKSFVTRIEEYKGRIVVETLIDMAEKMGVEQIAEGVETFAQIKILKQLGCHLFQGYYYGKPMDFTELSKYLLRSRRSHLRVVV